MRQTNILWKGREYDSLEHCLVTYTFEGVEIRSVIIGSIGGLTYRVEYLIKTNLHWETQSVELYSWHQDRVQHFRLDSDTLGNWMSPEANVTKFQGCIDIDIPLTPFTNSLPINRLNMTVGEAHVIKVLYFDVLEGAITTVNQKYTRTSQNTYHYENIPCDFEATIEVDASGLVTDYPFLFVRTAQQNANYMIVPTMYLAP
ncbi:MAG TPA: putative glycolipid-binding domain-containing protein [Cytophagales bacterium]|nr:putative glycolipid-binding domain-containing protein [Cytophagales bacterium]